MNKRILSFLMVCFLAFSLYISVAAQTASPQIISQSAVVMDANSGQVLYQKNMHQKMYPASITKIMTVLLAIENTNPSDVITMSHDAVFSVGRDTSHIALDEGEQLTVEQACYAAMLPSANDACNGIAELVAGSMGDFAKMMTSRAKSLGATNTNFVTTNGLHDDNHYTTAYDMALITKEAAKNPLFMEYTGTITYQMAPTNKQPEVRNFHNGHSMMQPTNYKYEDVIGGKTGFTDQAQHTLVTIAQRGNVKLIVVTLNSPAKSDKYKDTTALLDYCFDNFYEVEVDATEYASDFIAPEGDTASPNTQQIMLHNSLTVDDIKAKSQLESESEEGYDVSVELSIDDENGVMHPTIGATTVSVTHDKPQRSILWTILATIFKIVAILILAFIVFVICLRIFYKIRRIIRRRRRRKMARQLRNQK